MAEPWFDPNTFGAWFGAIVGAGGGTLGGLVGALASWLAPQGKGRRLVLSALVSLVVVGLLCLALGIWAILAGQPYGIWYGPLLCGFIFTMVPGFLIPMIRQRYAEAERRRIEGEAIRNS